MKLGALCVSAVVAGLLSGSALGRHAAPPGNRVVSCPGGAFSFTFDPKRGVRVTSGGRVLAAVSLGRGVVSKACAGVVRPHWGSGMAEPRNNVYRRATVRCRAAGPISIYLAPARGGRVTKRNVLVMAGDPPLNVVGAELVRARSPTATNIQRRRVPFLYRVPGNCR
jgi:hypothetical protein